MAKMLQLRPEGAREFYQEHEGKDFFDNLVNVMSSGPIWVMTLAKDNAVEEWRSTIGATHPAEAEVGTIRARFGDHNNITNNAVHGSATDHAAQREINFFFNWELNMALRVDEAERGAQIE
jgi:nucleoside-diphosphate kinase